jgi:hypothetical protein
VQPVSVVEHEVSDGPSNGDPQTEPNSPSEDCMSSTSKSSRKRRKAGKPAPKNRRRKTLRAKPTVHHGARGIAFRLSAEHDELLSKDAGTPSEALRSLLVTHHLLGNEHIDSVLFLGGYRASKKKGFWIVSNRSGKELCAYRSMENPTPDVKGWAVVDRDGKVAAAGFGSPVDAAKGARDVAFMRAEWLAQIGTGNVEPEDHDQPKDESKPKESKRKKNGERKGETKAFRLPPDERAALQRLATQNGTTLSAVLRSLLITQLVQHKKRLREIAIGGHRLYPGTDGGWAIYSGSSFIDNEPTLPEAFKRVKWMLKSKAA